MKQRKAQNSILVLATLGVYLGLVFVGATPQVMASAAMARQFDAREEIEVFDDFDNQPDDASDFLESYFEDLGAFVGDLRKLSSIDKFSADTPSPWTFERTFYSPCPATGTLVSEGPVVDIDHWVRPALTDAEYRVEELSFLGTCRPDDHFVPMRSAAKSVRVRIAFDRSGLNHELSIRRNDKADSLALLDHLRRAFDRLTVSDPDPSLQVLLQNTDFSAADDQVLIVTRLPRGSLASLLATDAK